MIEGPNQIIECPHCGSFIKVFTLQSGNTFGATFWSDGKMEAPMLPQPPALTRCYACRNFYWVAQANQVGELHPNITKGKQYPNIDQAWVDAPEVEEPSETEYWEALQSDVADEQNEERLRFLAWRRSNNAFRELSPDAAPSRSEAAIQNMQKLVEMINDENPGSRLMKAEILRELGRFDECINVLDTIDEEKLNSARDQILELAQAGSNQVARLHFD